MTKKEYIIKQIAKTNKKNYENYVITRIINLINDFDIKFVTQQYVRCDSKYYLSDLYFPQFNIFVEVDEIQHLKNSEADKARDRDFANSVNFVPKRIDVIKRNTKGIIIEDVSLENIHQQIDEVVELIKSKKNEQIKNKIFTPWNIDQEFNPDYWIEIGKISLDDNVAFRNSLDASKCIGKVVKGWSKGSYKHTKESNTKIWFPKLYENKKWNNSYNYSTNEITEFNKESDEARKNHVGKELEKDEKRIVFAHVKDNLNSTLYRFRGVYQLDHDKSNVTNGLIWKRVCDYFNTYDYKK